MTPASDGSAAAAYPGFGGQELDQLLLEHGWNLRVPSLGGPRAAGEGGSRRQEAERLFALEALRDFDWGRYRDVFLIAGSCLAYTMLLAPFFLDYRRLRKRREMESMSCRLIFGRLMEMLHWCGVLADMDGTEKSFQDKLQEAVPGCDGKKTEIFIKAVRNAAYGPGGESPEDAAAAVQVYRGIAEALYSRQANWKRFLFKYVKAF